MLKPITIATLGDCIAHDHGITVQCDSCRHRAELDLVSLAERLGEGQSILRGDLCPKLSCSACGAPNPVMSLYSIKAGVSAFIEGK